MAASLHVARLPASYEVAWATLALDHAEVPGGEIDLAGGSVVERKLALQSEALRVGLAVAWQSPSSSAFRIGGGDEGQGDLLWVFGTSFSPTGHASDLISGKATSSSALSSGTASLTSFVEAATGRAATSVQRGVWSPERLSWDQDFKKMSQTEVTHREVARVFLVALRGAFEWRLAGNLGLARIGSQFLVSVGGEPGTAVASQFCLTSANTLELGICGVKSRLEALIDHHSEIGGNVSVPALAPRTWGADQGPVTGAPVFLRAVRSPMCCQETPLLGAPCTQFREYFNLACPGSLTDAGLLGHAVCCTVVSVHTGTPSARTELNFPLYALFTSKPTPCVTRQARLSVSSLSVFTSSAVLRSAFIACSATIAAALAPKHHHALEDRVKKEERPVWISRADRRIGADRRRRQARKRKIIAGQGTVAGVSGTQSIHDRIRTMMLDAELAMVDDSDPLWELWFEKLETLQATKPADKQVTFAADTIEPTPRRSKPKRRRVSWDSIPKDAVIIIDPPVTDKPSRFSVGQPEEPETLLRTPKLEYADSRPNVSSNEGETTEPNSPAGTPEAVVLSDESLPTRDNSPSAPEGDGRWSLITTETVLSLCSGVADDGEDFFELLGYVPLCPSSCSCFSCTEPGWASSTSIVAHRTHFGTTSYLDMIRDVERARKIECMVAREGIAFLEELGESQTTQTPAELVPPPYLRVHSQRRRSRGDEGPEPVLALPGPTMTLWEKCQFSSPCEKPVQFLSVFPRTGSGFLAHGTARSVDDEALGAFCFHLAETYAACGFGRMSEVRATPAKIPDLGVAPLIQETFARSLHESCHIPFHLSEDGGYPASARSVRSLCQRFEQFGDALYSMLLRTTLNQTWFMGSSPLCVLLVNPLETAMVAAAALDAEKIGRTKLVKLVIDTLAQFVRKIHAASDFIASSGTSPLFVQLISTTQVHQAQNGQNRSLLRDVCFSVYSRIRQVSFALDDGTNLTHAEPSHTLSLQGDEERRLHVAYSVCEASQTVTMAFTDDCGSFRHEFISSAGEDMMERLLQIAASLVASSSESSWSVCVCRAGMAPSAAHLAIIQNCSLPPQVTSVWLCSVASAEEGYQPGTHAFVNTGSPAGAVGVTAHDAGPVPPGACDAVEISAVQRLSGDDETAVVATARILSQVQLQAQSTASTTFARLSAPAANQPQPKASGPARQAPASAAVQPAWEFPSAAECRTTVSTVRFFGHGQNHTLRDPVEITRIIARDFVRLSWLSASPSWPNRRSAMPVHVAQSIRSLRVARHVSQSFP